MFERLHNSPLGDELIEYCETLMSKICDVRNHKDEDESRAAKIAAKYIQRDLIDKIKLRHEMEKEEGASQAQKYE